LRGGITPEKIKMRKVLELITYKKGGKDDEKRDR